MNASIFAALSFEIVINQPWIALAASALASSIAVYLLYGSEASKRYGRLQRIGLGILRFVAVFVATLLLFSPVLKLERTIAVKPILGVAIDPSASMLMSPDSTYLKGDLSTDIAALKQAVGEAYDVLELQDAERTEFTQKETDLNKLVNDFTNRYTGQQIAGVILVSDGLHNSGPVIDPRRSNLTFPMYTMGVGDTAVKRDLRIEPIQTNSIAYVGNEFPIEVVLTGSKLPVAQVMLEVFDNGKRISFEQVKLNPDFTVHRSLVYGLADSVGVHRIEARIQTLDGEQNSRNNRSTAYVEVLDKKQRILLLAHSPHPDVGALKRRLEAGDISQVDLFYTTQDLPSLEDFDLVVTHQYPVSNEEFNFLKTIDSKGMPLFMVLGMQTRMDLFNKLNVGPVVTGNSGNHNYVQASMNEQFSNFTLSERVQSFLSDVPPLIAPFGEYKVAAGSGILAYQKIGRVTSELPLMANYVVNERRIGICYGEGLWRWALNADAETDQVAAFTELLRTEVQYLSVKADRRRFKCALGKTAVFENEGLELFAEYYNEAYEPVSDGKVTYTFVNEQGTTYSFDLTYNNGKYSRAVLGLPVGKYVVRAEATYKGERLTCTNAVQVNEVVLEQLVTTADHDLLKRLAEQTNGLFFDKQSWDALSTALQSRGDVPVIEKRKLRLEDMVNLTWLFFILFVALAGEWFIRRFAGDY